MAIDVLATQAWIPVTSCVGGKINETPKCMLSQCNKCGYFSQFYFSLSRAAFDTLLGKGAVFDRLITIGPQGARKLVCAYYKNWRMDAQGGILSDLQARGVGAGGIEHQPHYCLNLQLLTPVNHNIAKYGPISVVKSFFNAWPSPLSSSCESVVS